MTKYEPMTDANDRTYCGDCTQYSEYACWQCKLQYDLTHAEACLRERDERIEELEAELAAIREEQYHTGVERDLAE